MKLVYKDNLARALSECTEGLQGSKAVKNKLCQKILIILIRKIIINLMLICKANFFEKVSSTYIQNSNRLRALL